MAELGLEGPALLAMVALVEAGWCTEAEAEAVWRLLRDRVVTDPTIAATRVTLNQLLAIVRGLEAHNTDG